MAALESKRGFEAASMKAGQAAAAKFGLEGQAVIEIIQEKVNIALTELHERIRAKLVEIQERQYRDSENET